MFLNGTFSQKLRVDFEGDKQVPFATIIVQTIWNKGFNEFIESPPKFPGEQIYFTKSRTAFKNYLFHQSMKVCQIKALVKFK
jgi:hypothetical protein